MENNFNQGGGESNPNPEANQPMSNEPVMPETNAQEPVMEQPSTGGKNPIGAIIAIIIVVALLVVAGFYFWGKEIDNGDDMMGENNTDTTMNGETEIPTDATVEEIDEVLEDMNIDDLDEELENIESELEL